MIVESMTKIGLFMAVTVLFIAILEFCCKEFQMCQSSSSSASARKDDFLESLVHCRYLRVIMSDCMIVVRVPA